MTDAPDPAMSISTTPDGLAAGDPQDMLGAVASAGAQIRDGLAAVGELDLGPAAPGAGRRRNGRLRRLR